eukprot:3970214-Pleurochrysis_carterae.AAC.2
MSKFSAETRPATNVSFKSAQRRLSHSFAAGVLSASVAAQGLRVVRVLRLIKMVRLVRSSRIFKCDCRFDD